MKPLYLGSGRALFALSLAASLICLIAALYTHHNAFIIASIVLAIVPVLVSAFATESRRPSEFDLRDFLARELQGKVGGDAFAVETVKPGSFAALYADRMYVSFRAQVVLKQTLFKTTDIPWSKFGGITNRQLAAVRKRATTVADILGAEAADLIEKMPPDMFTLFYIAPVRFPRERFSLAGGLTAMPCGYGWNFSLRHVAWERRRVEDLGRTLFSFGNSVVVGTQQGDARIAELVAAWKEYFQILAVLEAKVLASRTSRGEHGVESFLAEVKAGTLFHGMGHSSSGQHAPTAFFVEIRSVNADEKTLTFLLRNDGPWENARRFHATVSYNATDDMIGLHASTERRDSFANSGPLIGAPAGFSMDFHFTSGPPARLETMGGDVSMQLVEIPREALSRLRDQIFARKKQAQQLVAAGAYFEGSYIAGDTTVAVSVFFVESSAPGGPVEAKVETTAWSDMFLVTLATNPYESGNHDVVLSPLAMLQGDVDAKSAPEVSRRLRLSLAPTGLAGVLECAEGAFELALRRATPLPEHAAASAPVADTR